MPDPNRTVKRNLLPGYYTVDALVNEFDELKTQNPKFDITAKANTPLGSMILYSKNNITFSNSLLQPLGIKRLSFITFVKRLSVPNTYFVHCDLIDKKGKTCSMESL